MVCQRCILAVEQILQAEKIPFVKIDLGMVETKEDLTNSQQEALKKQLQSIGFEWIDDQKTALIEQLKQIIIQSIQNDRQPFHNWSHFLKEELNHDYKYLSQLFSSVHGLSIEQFIIRQKIERVKELISYDQKTLSQISNEMHYSSVAHLSAQFKKVTGITPSFFKKNRVDRTPIDRI